MVNTLQQHSDCQLIKLQSGILLRTDLGVSYLILQLDGRRVEALVIGARTPTNMHPGRRWEYNQLNRPYAPLLGLQPDFGIL